MKVWVSMSDVVDEGRKKHTRTHKIICYLNPQQDRWRAALQNSVVKHQVENEIPEQGIIGFKETGRKILIILFQRLS